jgi:uncharacterized protein
VLADEEYLALRNRPAGLPAMYQSWRDLTFLHYSIEPEVIQVVLPPGLTVDTYPDAQGVERAWVGLVPFRMQGVRHRRSPAVPGCHAFPETNVRTYVHRDGKEPGVWFFSLDAANPTACAVARRSFNLPYFPARMSTRRDESKVNYESARWRGLRAKGGTIDQPPANLKAEVTIGEPVDPVGPGTLEFFLVERYVLYAERRGQLYTGQVSHVPYPLRKADMVSVEQSLMAAAGLPERAWEHVLFSDGVDVEVFGIKPVA